MANKSILTWEDLIKYQRATFITDNRLIIELTFRDGFYTNSN